MALKRSYLNKQLMNSLYNQFSNTESQRFQTQTHTFDLKAIGFTDDKILLPDGSVLDVLEVVRVVPNKRLVCRCFWNGLNVYAKIFIGKQSRRYTKRDLKGVDLLYRAGIKTPSLLLHTQLNNRSAEILIFEEVIGALNAERAYLDKVGIDDLLERLVIEVALHHQSNIIQTDLYLKNFLVRDIDIYTLDGDGIRQFSALSRKKALANLATLLSKFDVLLLEKMLPRLISVYASTRLWQSTPNLLKMKQLVNAYRIDSANKYSELKVFRQCTDVNVFYSAKHFLAISMHLNISNRLASEVSSNILDALLEKSDVIKDGRTCTVGKVWFADHDIVIKRYNIKNIGHAISRAFRRTRASLSWANAHRLNILGILTPQPMMLLENRFFGIRNKAYFISAYIDAPDVQVYLEQNKNQHHVAIKNIVNLFYQLHLLKLSHGDMKASNIKMINENPCLIDLDSMLQHRYDFFALKGHVQDLQRFMQNWQRQSTLYNMFVKEFSAVYSDHKALRLAGLIH
jgi:tRNA A-37 threonylcarbamoyl transferase component Bud32